MNRIMIVGPCGSGKSTLAVRLRRMLGIASYHLDQLSFAANWVERPEEEWRSQLERIVASERWIIDGNDAGTMPIRLARADTVLFLDFAPARCVWRVLKRVATHRGATRPDMAPDCPERLSLSFLFYVATWNGSPRKRVETQLSGSEGKIVTVKDPKSLEGWLSTLACPSSPKR